MKKSGRSAGLAAWWRTLKDADGEKAQKQICRVHGGMDSCRAGETRPTFPNLKSPAWMSAASRSRSGKSGSWKRRTLSISKGTALKLSQDFYLQDTAAAAAMKVPGDEAAIAEYEKAFERFAAVFPDDFVVTERAPVYLNPNSGEGS